MDLYEKMVRANLSDQQWRREARVLAREAKLHAQVAQRRVYRIPFMGFLESNESKAAEREAYHFRQLEDELRRCHFCEVGVKYYYAALDRSWTPPSCG